MSNVYRYHGPANLPTLDRLIQLRKRKQQETPNHHLIGADVSTITCCHGTSPIEEYVPTSPHIVTLTRREADLIALANPGVAAPAALEDLHPWLPECRFLNDSKASFRAAEAIVARFRKHLIAASSFCDEKWNTICNTLRRTSVYDTRYYSAWHLPIQQAYTFEEARPDRTVIAIDFNAMYPSCMQHDFPKPSALKFAQLGRNFSSDETLPTGLYRCILHEPATQFILDHNPFRSFHYGRRLQARIQEPVMIDLNEFEVAYFSRHFRQIYLVEAVVSDETVAHPLAKEARRAFARRVNFKQQGNKALADREKLLATFMASCANRPSRPTTIFDTYQAAVAHIQSHYGIRIPEDEPELATEIWLDGRKGVSVNRNKNCIEVRGPTLHNGSACHLLGQRIVARSRVVLLGMMERILANASDAQICYANIDSIHFTVPNAQRSDVITWLEQHASEEMGSFKIEAISPFGLWLEPGRYWLYSDTEVVKFRNRSVGDGRNPFKDHKTHLAIRRIGDLHVPIKVTLDMVRTMSPSLSVKLDGHNGLSRQNLIEAGDNTSFSDIADELEHNQRQAIPARMKAFQYVRDKIETSRNAATVREASTTIV